MNCIDTDQLQCVLSGRQRENTQSRKTESKRVHQRPSRKLYATCLSCIYVDEFSDGHVEFCASGLRAWSVRTQDHTVTQR